MSQSKKIEDLIHERGPLTVAAFMDIALYDRDLGYYARAARRWGRAGDFFTSVDVGAMFGELLEVQVAEMAWLLAGLNTCTTLPKQDIAQDLSPAFDFVEADVKTLKCGLGQVIRKVLDRHRVQLDEAL